MFKPARMVKAFFSVPIASLDPVLWRLQEEGCAHFFDIKKTGQLVGLEPIPEKSVEARSALDRARRPLHYDFLSNLFGKTVQRIELTRRQTTENLLQYKADSENDILIEQLEDALAIEKTKALGGRIGDKAFFSFWVPVERKGKIQRILHGLILEFEEPLPEDTPPTLLSNPPGVSPFELLTSGFRVPAYDEVDPTPLVALSFVAFFGFMFADAGWGLLLLVLSMVVLFRTTKKDRLQRQLNYILAFCALSSIAFGTYFGEFFGYTFRQESISDNVSRLLYASLAAGVAHLAFSAICQLFGKHRNHGFGLLFALAGITGYFFKPEAALFALVGFAFLLHQEGFAAVKEILVLASSVVSYLRLAALALVHIVTSRILMDALINLSSNVASFIFGAFLFVAAGMVLLVYGTLLVFIQSLRLQWLEFFRFYPSTAGLIFAPLTLKGISVRYS